MGEMQGKNKKKKKTWDVEDVTFTPVGVTGFHS
jgi:hypothetical protein